MRFFCCLDHDQERLFFPSFGVLGDADVNCSEELDRDFPDCFRLGRSGVVESIVGEEILSRFFLALLLWNMTLSSK